MEELLKKLPESWRSTSLGIALLLYALASGAAALLDNDPSTVLNIDEIGAAVVGFLAIWTREQKAHDKGE